jgi:hypothetical protein
MNVPPLASVERALAGLAMARLGGLQVEQRGSRHPDLSLREPRLLGARHLAEAAILTVFPTKGVVTAIRAVDAVHALSMAAIAVVCRGERRPALTSLAVTVCLTGSLP